MTTDAIHVKTTEAQIAALYDAVGDAFTFVVRMRATLDRLSADGGDPAAELALLSRSLRDLELHELETIGLTAAEFYRASQPVAAQHDPHASEPNRRMPHAHA